MGVMCEGLLTKKRTGVRRKGFIKRYFRLEDGVLSYSKEASSATRGRQDLQVAAITVDKKKRRIIVDGATVWQLRAESEVDFKKWTEALRAAKMAHHARASLFSANIDLGPSPPGKDRSVSILDGRPAGPGAPHTAGSASRLLDNLTSQLEGAKNCQERVATSLDLLQKSGPSMAGEVVRSVNDMMQATSACISTVRSEERLWRERFAAEEDRRRWLEIAVRTLEASLSQLQKEKEDGMFNTPTGSTPVSKGSVGSSAENNFFVSREDSDESESEFEDAEDSEYETADDEDIQVGSQSRTAPVVRTPSISRSESSDSIVSKRRSMLGFRTSVVYPKVLRASLPCGKVDDGPSMWSVLKKNIGKDLSKVALPVTFNEPLGALQKLAEEFEYCPILIEASQMPKSVDRILRVAAFVVSGYASTITRAQRKPFNPVLGETYEYVDPNGKFRFMAEQVSHHPPVSACHCSCDAFEMTESSTIKNKFWGKSMEIIPNTSIQLKFPGCKDVYSWNKVTTTIHNIMVGEMWLDHHGDCEIKNTASGDKCKLNFAQAGGWFNGGNKNEISGTVFDSSGSKVYTLSGRWNSSVSATNTQTGESFVLWEASPLPADYQDQYGFTSFAIGLNGVTEDIMRVIPPTDSRHRPDQRALEDGKVDAAGDLKKRVEDKQRADRARREGAGEEWKPLWFNGSGTSWSYNGEYWKKHDSTDKKRWKQCPSLWV